MRRRRLGAAVTARLPRGSLDRSSILRAAEDLAGRSGLAEVTIRRIAAELGVRHTAVHHHFPRRADLVEALLVEAVERFNAAFPEVQVGGAWQSDVRAYWSAFRDVLRSDRALFELVVGQWVVMGRSRRALDLSLQRIDMQIGVLLAAGFTEVQAGYAYHLLSTYTRGCLISEYQFGGAGADGAAPAAGHELLRDPDAFPNLRRVVARNWSYTFATDADFDHGLEVILGGLQAWLAAGEPARHPGHSTY
jgi:TetR/AcrR family tetracycline transcriptional repressor